MARPKKNARNARTNSMKETDSMKYEIANEFGVALGPDTTSRANGSVGGEITRRLVQSGMNNISGSYQNK